MKTNNPILGLLKFLFHSASGNFAVIFPICIALSFAFIVTGNSMFFVILVITAMLTLPMVLITNMAAKEGKWERYQLTMPIKRSDLIKMQYYGVLLTTMAAAAIIIATVGISIALAPNQYMFEYGLARAIVGLMFSLGMPLLMVGLTFPLASSKIGKNRESSILSICMFFTLGVNMLLPRIGTWVGLSDEMIAVAAFGVSVLIFIVSFFITRMLYNKMDF